MCISSRRDRIVDCRLARCRALVVCSVAGVLIGACQSAPESETAAVPSPERVAQQAIDQARGTTDAQRRAGAFLRALVALYDHRDFVAAANIVETMRSTAIDGRQLVDALSDEARFRFDATALELLLNDSDPDASAEAEELAVSLAPANVGQRRRADDLRIRAFAALSDHASAALALMAVAERGLYTNAPLLAGHIWRRLSKLAPPALAGLAATVGGQRAQWLLLAKDLSSALTDAEQVHIWRQWAANHPHHVAARSLRPPALEPRAPWPQPVRSPSQLALLLPFSGELAAFAEAIRDGFVAAHLLTLQRLRDQGAAGTAQNAAIRTYDTAAMSIGEAYRRARSDGAAVIVGPLEKSAVGELAAMSPALPVLALNSVDEGALASPNLAHVGAPMVGGGSETDALQVGEGTATAPSFLQLTLAVEDPAVAIAAALKADGAERIVLFDNQEAWSPRAELRLRAELEEIQVVAEATLTGIGNVTEAAGEVLGIAASNARNDELSRLLGTSLTFLPRRRQDIDAVVVLANATQLTALRPALEFHFAGDLPIYAPSQAVRGIARGALDGVRACTIPWWSQEAELRQQTTAFEASGDSLLAPLFALGMDAYRIVNQLPRFIVLGESIAGSVGLLSVGADGRIRRQLHCDASAAPVG